jgi:hypothetical protein
MNAISTLSSSPAGLVDWLDHPPVERPAHSVVVSAECCADIESIGGDIATYLNEFDESATGLWRSFSPKNLRQLAGDPSCRDLIIDGLPKDLDLGPPFSDLDRIIRRLGSLGGAILEGQASLDASHGLANTFQVCLCCTDHTDDESHMWLNPNRFTREGIVSVIADSFLDWVSRLEQPPTASGRA